METSGNETNFNPDDCGLPDVRTTDLYKNKTVFLIYFIQLIFLCFCILFENTIVLFAFYRVKTLRQRRNVLICSLALTDFCTGIMLPIQILGPPSVADAVSFSMLLLSVLTILLIAIERFYVLVVMTKRLQRDEERRSAPLICICFVLWVGTLALFVPWAMKPYAYILILYTVGPLSVIIVMVAVVCLYVAIFHSMRKMDLQKQKYIGKKDFQRTKVVLRAYGIIVFTFVLCWFPWSFEAIRIGWEIYINVEPDERQCYYATTVACFLLNLGLLNSALNPIIYWKNLPDFREAICSLFSCCPCGCKKAGRSNENESSTGIQEDTSMTEIPKT
ncbi:sphingosine 1-phosphate receptor 1-like isoform X2 [Anneissia japonica]|nr:sphingosine 1-phosphate receptor 1-like isoform X2 [Anneissia japonica]XP_033103277.1 sphingosine 1-phosphate receptor 1-like isoform X2 [Anneissia japonica]XP_033103278.1 sphingosine 1-phosphate receptor 1-like isoform X2 [Anneissia japonica]XP_033103279.1 sphingosine 1-phosphate receptor 1-like isoform X2 [Anneissia japonica]XP_033103280.1 sphingosine 1-phosphate receptor 1-like isoform X2 [Anneissia japonica]